MEESGRIKEKVLSPGRKKKLMKKLERIKLNRSREKSSLLNQSSYYNGKFLRLKANNVALAKALAEEKQSSKSWCDVVVALKAELQESQENLLRVTIREKEIGSNESIVAAAVERRIRNVAEPLQCAVEKSLSNVFDLVENLSEVKQLLITLLKPSKEKLTCSRASRGSDGSRPPLSRTPKSPRKNVVHPMVEGHVLQPAAIHIPRMSLEDRRRYRLQEWAEIREDQAMEVIGEQVASEEEQVSTPVQIDGSPSDEAETTTEHPLNDSSDQPIQENEIYSAPAEMVSSPSPEVQPSEKILLMNSPVEGKMKPPVQCSPQVSPKENVLKEVDSVKINATSLDSESIPTVGHLKANQKLSAELEDPLEGSSWMHTKKRRQLKKKKSKSSSEVALKRSSGMHFLPENSSDSDDDGVSIPISLYPRKKSPEKSHSEQKVVESDTLSPDSLLRLQDENRISRRLRKKSGGSERSSVADVKMHDECNKSANEMNSKVFSNVKDTETVPYNSPLLSSEPNTSDLRKDPPEQENLNATSLFQSPMDITKCLNKEIFQPTKVCNSLENTEEEKPSDLKLNCLTNNKMQAKQNLTFDKSLIQHSDDELTQPKLERLLSNPNFGNTPAVDSSDISVKNELLKSKIKDNDDDRTVPKEESPKNEGEYIRKESKLPKPSQKKKSGKKFFKCEKEVSVPSMADSQPEKTPYDISMMDASILDTILSKGKENIPPEMEDIIESNIDESPMKLKDLSIIIKDIMKTPPTDTTKNTNSNFESAENRSASSSSKILSSRTKRKELLRRGDSSSNQAMKKYKRINFLNDSVSSQESENEEVWYPTKKTSTAKRKRTTSKKKPRKKSPTNGKLVDHPLKYLDQGDDASLKANMTPQTTAAKCEIKELTDEEILNATYKKILDDVDPIYLKDLKSLPPDPLSDVYNHVNDIILNNITINSIYNSDNMANPKKVQDESLNDKEDDDNEEPLVVAIVNNSLKESAKSRPRRAALKVSSFKEPSLNAKLRQDSTKRKGKKSLKKVSSKS